MSKPEHTPGPWVVAGQIGHARWIVAETGPVHLATTYGPNVNPNSEADTRLIVAAPDLLKILKDTAVRESKDGLLCWCDCDPGALDKHGNPYNRGIHSMVCTNAREVIARAEGGT